MYYTNSHTNIQLWIMKYSHYVHYSQAISGVYVSFMSMSWATWKRLRLISFLYTAICLKTFYIIKGRYADVYARKGTLQAYNGIQSNIFDLEGLDFINWT